MKQIAIFFSDGVQSLDITGPVEVFSAASEAKSGDPFYEICLVSPKGGPVTAGSSIQIITQPMASISPNAIDTLLVAGHGEAGTLRLMGDETAQSWVTSVTRLARRWGSVCSGAFPLASWGLLNGKRAATHWIGAAELGRRFPQVTVDEDALYVVDGNSWTSAGVTAGIDMALAMVEADLGNEIASQVARRLVVYLRRPGNQSQFSAPLKHQSSGASQYHDLIAWAAAHLKSPLTIEALATHMAQSPRTFQRHFTRELGRSPAKVIEELRIDRAKALISAGARLQSVAEEVGYPSASQLTAAFRRQHGVAPSVWKAMHAGQ